MVYGQTRSCALVYITFNSYSIAVGAPPVNIKSIHVNTLNLVITHRDLCQQNCVKNDRHPGITTRNLLQAPKLQLESQLVRSYRWGLLLFM